MVEKNRIAVPIGSSNNRWTYYTPDKRLEASILRVPFCECWLWVGVLNEAGYGLFNVKIGDFKRSFRAHRYVYEKHNGPIQDGMDLDHLCRVRHCVNPAHLDPVTKAENLRRSPILNPSVCIRGHEFSPENTVYLGSKPTWRRCVQCNRIRNAKAYEKKIRLRATVQT